MSEIIQAFFPLLLATLIAIWIYRLSLKYKEAKEKEFETIEFCGQKYACVDWEEKQLSLRVLTLIQKVKQGDFGVVKEKREPLIVLLPMDEFLRLKTIEEHLDDLEIGRIIEERIKNRAKEETHPMQDYEAFREKLYTHFPKE